MQYMASARGWGIISFFMLIFLTASEGYGIGQRGLWVKKPYVSSEICGAITRADNDIQLRRIKKLESAERISIDQFFSEVKDLRRKSQSGK